MLMMVRCRLLEPDGTLLTIATCALISGGAVLNALERPGRVVKRCLLDHLHEIQIELDDSVVLHGRVERVYFDPEQGRVCTVRLKTAEPVPVPSFVASR
jgi:hypothetical protein